MKSLRSCPGGSKRAMQRETALLCEIRPNRSHKIDAVSLQFLEFLKGEAVRFWGAGIATHEAGERATRVTLAQHDRRALDGSQRAACSGLARARAARRRGCSRRARAAQPGRPGGRSIDFDSRSPAKAARHALPARSRRLSALRYRTTDPPFWPLPALHACAERGQWRA